MTGDIEERRRLAAERQKERALQALRRPGPGEKEVRKPGRAHVEVDAAKLEMLCQIGATDEEICGHMHISDSTLRRMRKNPQWAAIMDKSKADGKISLRRAQWKSALGGSPTMQIWLGKQELGQRDTVREALLAGSVHEILGEFRRVLDEMSDDQFRRMASELGVRLMTEEDRAEAGQVVDIEAEQRPVAAAAPPPPSDGNAGSAQAERHQFPNALAVVEDLLGAPVKGS